MNRRCFLLSPLGLVSASLYAAPARPRFLFVFLRGGYDAANLLVPASGFYYESRPNIAVPRETLLSSTAYVRISSRLRATAAACIFR